MPRAIRIHEVGGPEVMRLEDVDIEAPSAGEVQVLHTAIGVNFIDVYDRSGLYPQKQMPGWLGREAAGIVSALGKERARISRRAIGSPMCTAFPARTARCAMCRRIDS